MLHKVKVKDSNKVNRNSRRRSAVVSNRNTNSNNHNISNNNRSTRLHRNSHSKALTNNNRNRASRNSHSKASPHNRACHKGSSHHRNNRTRSRCVADFTKSANALFLEHYGDLLRSGHPPTEALRLAKDDWFRSLDGLNGLTLDDHARYMETLVQTEGRRLSQESFQRHKERLTALKGLQLALTDLYETEAKQ